jgi:hypothetical protein
VRLLPRRRQHTATPTPTAHCGRHLASQQRAWRSHGGGRRPSYHIHIYIRTCNMRLRTRVGVRPASGRVARVAPAPLRRGRGGRRRSESENENSATKRNKSSISQYSTSQLSMHFPVSSFVHISSSKFTTSFCDIYYSLCRHVARGGPGAPWATGGSPPGNANGRNLTK